MDKITRMILLEWKIRYKPIYQTILHKPRIAFIKKKEKSHSVTQAITSIFPFFIPSVNTPEKNHEFRHAFNALTQSIT